MKIKLTTLSPVCIGNGGKLSPTSDYIYDWKSKQIHYINKDVVAAALANNDDLMDEYVNGILYGMDNNRTLFNLKDFLEKKLKLIPEEYIAYSVKANIKSAKELNTIIKNADGSPYIPGSTIKGALKNALVYNHMGANKKDFILPLLKDIEYGINEKQFEDKLKKINNSVDAFFVEKLNRGKTEITIPKNKFGVSDSDLLDGNVMQVSELERISLFTDDEISQPFENIKKDTTSYFTLDVEDYKDEKSLTVEKIFKRVNIYTQNNINIEKEIIGTYTKNEAKHDELLQQYDEYLSIVKNLSDKECLLRIGFGKGFYFNSVAQLIYRFDETENKSIFAKYLSLLGYKDEDELEDFPENAYIFPITRNVSSQEVLSIGWVKLEMV